MEKYLRWGIYTGIFAILFTPLLIANDFFFPFITGKNFTFRIIVEIIFALWIILALKDVSVRPKRSGLLITLLLFVASLGVSTIFAENPIKSFWSNFERMEGYITLLHLGAYFLVTTSVLNTEKLWRRFWNTSIGVSVLVGLYGVFQLAGFLTINQGGVRVDATFGNATYLAVYMLFHVFITLVALTSWKPSRLFQIGYVVALILQVLMVFYAATRGTILGLVGGLFLSGLIFFLFGKGSTSLRRGGAALLAGIVLVTGGFFLVKDTEFVRGNEVLTRIASISLEEGQTRFTIWGMAWEGFKERPVFGWGQENFNYVFNKHYDASLYAQEPWFDRVHNIYLDWLIAGGIFGFVLYLLLFVFTLWYLWKPSNVFSLSERALITGLLAGYGFHNMFVFDNLMSYMLFISVLAYVAFRHTKEKPTLFKEKEFSQTLTTTVSAVVVVLLVATLYLVNVPGMLRATDIINAIRPHEEGLTRNFEIFQNVTQGSGMGSQEAHEQLLQFSTRILSPDIAHLSTPELQNEVAVYARNKFLDELERAPNDARLRLFYASFLRQIGDTEGARTELERAHELSPQKQIILLERGVLETNTGNVAASLDFFKQAYELAPAFDQARVFYSGTLIRAGQLEIASQLLVERFGTATPDNDIILQAYIDVGDFTSVIAVAENRVANDPNNFERRVQLAGAYLQVNRRSDAIASLREAIRVNPDFSEQGEFFISEIEAGRNP